MKKDEESIHLAKYALSTLGCPSLKEGEGNVNFKSFNETMTGTLRKPYKKTPDLISGPNNGDKLDFYIDVHSPDGSMFKNRSRGPLKNMAQDISTMVSELDKIPLGERLSLNITEYDKEYLAEVANPFSKKIHKYGDLRKSHLFGFVGVFDGRNQDSAMYVDISAAIFADYLFMHLHNAFNKDFIMNSIISGMHKRFHEETDELIRLSVPIDNYMAFYLLVGFGKLKNKGLLIVNQNIFDIDEYKNHTTVKWLNSIVKSKKIIKVPSY